jgi:hypothetical protein
MWHRSGVGKRVERACRSAVDYGSRLWGNKIGYDEKFAMLAGLVLTHETLRWCCEHRCFRTNFSAVSKLGNAGGRSNWEIIKMYDLSVFGRKLRRLLAGRQPERGAGSLFPPNICAGICRLLSDPPTLRSSMQPPPQHCLSTMTLKHRCLPLVLISMAAEVILVCREQTKVVLDRSKSRAAYGKLQLLESCHV